MKTKDYTFFDKHTTVHGNLTTTDVILEGSFRGSINANGSVLLAESVIIEADINTPNLRVEEGATYEGRIFLTNKKT